MNTTLLNWLLAIPAAILIGALGVALDADDHRGEFKLSTELEAAQRQSQALMRREAAGRAVCRDRHGEAIARWTDTGELVCIARKGGQRMAAL